ncbi:MAG: T9SS type A sorting domain-containing protein, partial [Marinirhabdus sp.]|nr:T9SS type A sorting domain-containing protein [Marinirhabdus sp.]
IQKGSTNLAAAVGNITSTTGGVLYSNDGFATVQQATGLPTAQMYDLLYYEETFFLAGDAAMYSSTDDGVSWAVKGTGHPTNGSYIKTVSQSGNLFGADINGKGLFKSSDLGETWALTDPGTFMDFCQIFDIAAGGGYLFAVVDGVNCSPENIAIRYSSDSGVTWNSGLFNIPQAFYDELGVTADGSCFFVYAVFEQKLYSSCDLPLGIPDLATTSLQVYPNPTDGIITIKGAVTDQIKVHDVTGSLLKIQHTTSEITVIDLSDASAGVYFVSVETGGGKETIKVVKK